MAFCELIRSLFISTAGHQEIMGAIQNLKLTIEQMQSAHRLSDMVQSYVLSRLSPYENRGPASSTSSCLDFKWSLIKAFKLEAQGEDQRRYVKCQATHEVILVSDSVAGHLFPRTSSVSDVNGLVAKLSFS
jgi:hypothetical protein